MSYVLQPVKESYLARGGRAINSTSFSRGKEAKAPIYKWSDLTRSIRDTARGSETAFDAAKKGAGYLNKNSEFLNRGSTYSKAIGTVFDWATTGLEYLGYKKGGRVKGKRGGMSFSNKNSNKITINVGTSRRGPAKNVGSSAGSSAKLNPPSGVSRSSRGGNISIFHTHSGEGPNFPREPIHNPINASSNIAGQRSTTTGIPFQSENRIAPVPGHFVNGPLLNQINRDQATSTAGSGSVSGPRLTVSSILEDNLSPFYEERAENQAILSQGTQSAEVIAYENSKKAIEKFPEWIPQNGGESVAWDKRVNEHKRLEKQRNAALQTYIHMNNQTANATQMKAYGTDKAALVNAILDVHYPEPESRGKWRAEKRAFERHITQEEYARSTNTAFLDNVNSRQA